MALPLFIHVGSVAPPVGPLYGNVWWLDTTIPALPVAKRYTGTVWETIAAVAINNYRTLVTLGADVTNNNIVPNTLQDVTGLSFPVVAGVRYRFQIIVPYTAGAVTTGSRWTLNGPAASLLAYTSRYTLTATSQTVNFATAYSTPAASNASSLTAGNIAIIEGVIVPSADGTVQVRFASEIANSAIVAKAGASLEWW
jgi:hypothetical protein